MLRLICTFVRLSRDTADISLIFTFIYPRIHEGRFASDGICMTLFACRDNRLLRTITQKDSNCLVYCVE